MPARVIKSRISCGKDVAGFTKREGVEDFGEDRAEDCGQGDLPVWKESPDQEHGEDVEEAEVGVDRVPPVDEGDNRNERGGGGKHGAGTPGRVA